MKLSTSLLILLLVFNISIMAQGIGKSIWNGKQCAVVLTYDDGLNVHIDNVVPALDERGFKGTFYIPGKAETLNTRQLKWRMIAAHGHELGNHTLFHPCDASKAGREWVNTTYDLSQYNVERMVDEIKVANTLLQAVDGKTERTFAYTCGDTHAGDSSFVDLIKNEFVGARTVVKGSDQMEDVDLFHIKCHSMRGHTAEEMIAIVEQGMKENALVVFLFHGVGGEHRLNVSLRAHQALLDYLAKNESNIWVDNLYEVSKFINKR